MGRTATALSLLLAGLFGGCGGEQNRFPSMDALRDVTALAGEPVEIVVRAEDPDGDALTFYIEGRPEGAEFSQSATAATFRWSPSITDASGDGKPFVVTITVSDEHGAWVAQDVTITVFPPGGVPRFLNPHGYVLNLAQAEYLTFRLEVKDDDTSTVTIDLPQTIDGAVFRVEGPKSATFYWEPTAEQIEAKSVHTIVATANDGVHPPVRHDISVVLLNPQAARECPGQPPTLQHAPLPDQNGESAYVVTLEAFDVESVVRFPTVFWAAGSDPSAVAFQAIAMTPDDEQRGTFTARLPAAMPAGEAGFVSYYFSASDNDDVAAERCDHLARLPKDGLYRFVAYGSGTPDALCLQDGREPNDTAADASELAAGDYAALRLCPHDSDWYRVPIGPDVRATITLHYTPSHGALEFGVFDATMNPLGEASSFGDRAVIAVPPIGAERVLYVAAVGTPDTRVTYGLTIDLTQAPCEEDPREPDGSTANATYVEPPGQGFHGTICGGDTDWFAVTTTGNQHLAVTLDLSPLDGDLDMAVVGPDGTTALAKVERTGVTHEELSLNLEDADTYYVRIYSLDGGGGVYDVAIDLADQSVSCQDDFLAPNHDRSGAVIVPEGAYDEQILCPGRPDWYQVGLNGGEHLSVLVEAGDASRRFTLELRDVFGTTTIERVESTDGYAALDLELTDPGDYVFVVAGDEEGALTYKMMYWAEDPPGPCREDRFSPNHGFAEAREIWPIFTTRAKLCNGTTDWYRFEAPANTEVSAALQFPSDGGALHYAVYDRDVDAPIVRDESGTGALVSFVTDALGGTYYIEVQGPEVDGQHYDIGVLWNP